jgi:hypothetical protein
MLLPDERHSVPSHHFSRNAPLNAWARIESKSETTQQDLLRDLQREPARYSLHGISLFVMHIVHALISSKTLEQ